MTGEQVRPLENRPYLKLWQERIAAEELKKSIKAAQRKRDAKPRKQGKKRKVKS